MSHAPSDSRAVVVLGPGRSGTSSVAGILQILGVHMGDVAWQGTDRWNVHGYFEDRAFFDLNERILAAAGGSWREPPPREAVLEAGAAFRDEIRRAIEGRRGTWGWKDPRSVLTIELFLPYLPSPRIVVVLRSPVHVAASLARREPDLAGARGLRLTHTYLGRLLDFLEAHPELPTAYVAYEDVVARPTAEAERLAAFLGLEPSEEQRTALTEFVLSRGELEEGRARRELDLILHSRAWRLASALQRLKRRLPVLHRL